MIRVDVVVLVATIKPGASVGAIGTVVGVVIFELRIHVATVEGNSQFL